MELVHNENQSAEKTEASSLENGHTKNIKTTRSTTVELIDDWMPDKVLQKYVANSLGIPIENITKNSYLFSLYLGENTGFGKVQDLKGLECFPGLKTLTITGEVLPANLSQLANLVNLDTLYLNGLSENQKLPVAISTFPIIENLEYLIARNCYFENIEQMPNFPKLSVLDIQYSNITNLDGIKNIISLEQLSLMNNELSDLNGTSKLINLTDLTVMNNQLENLNGLENNQSLLYLFASCNQIKDISAISQLTSLAIVLLSDNQIQEVPPLTNHTQLMALHLDNNQISKVNELPKSGTLHELRVSNNQLTDIKFLSTLSYYEDFPGILTFTVHENYIKDLTFETVAEFSLFIYAGNQIVTLDPILIADNELYMESPIIVPDFKWRVSLGNPVIQENQEAFVANDLAILWKSIAENGMFETEWIYEYYTEEAYITKLENIYYQGIVYQPFTKGVNIKYDGNGHTSGDVPATDLIKLGTEYQIQSAATILKTKHEFVEWNTKVDGSGEGYASTNKINPMDSLTLYAIWEEQVETPEAGTDSTDTSEGTIIETTEEISIDTEENTKQTTKTSTNKVTDTSTNDAGNLDNGETIASSETDKDELAAHSDKTRRATNKSLPKTSDTKAHSTGMLVMGVVMLLLTCASILKKIF